MSIAMFEWDRKKKENKISCLGGGIDLVYVYNSLASASTDFSRGN
jgi:hypothetical protein